MCVCVRRSRGRCAGGSPTRACAEGKERDVRLLKPYVYICGITLLLCSTGRISRRRSAGYTVSHRKRLTTVIQTACDKLLGNLLCWVFLSSSLCCVRLCRCRGRTMRSSSTTSIRVSRSCSTFRSPRNTSAISITVGLVPCVVT